MDREEGVGTGRCWWLAQGYEARVGDTLEPYDDQWLFLSTLDRLSLSDAQRVARQAKRTLVGNDVMAMSRSETTRVQPPMPPVVRADPGAGLRLDTSELPPAAVSTFKHAASTANPEFYQRQRLRKSTWDTPIFIRGYDITLDDHLVLQRGLRHGHPDRRAGRVPAGPHRRAQPPAGRST